MATDLKETDTSDELPLGWDERVTLDGKVFYANHDTKATQWTHPITGKKKRITGELPLGWEKRVQENGTVIYIDHNTQITTYTDPRLAFAIEEMESQSEIKQRFDASSTALQVLHGRDLNGFGVIITGGNCGIGYETARALAFHGAHVIMACRNMENANNAIEKIQSERPRAKLTALKCDLLDLNSVKEFVTEFEALNLPLNILILNAAVFMLPHSMTNHNIEGSFQVNHLSQFYMTQLLKDKLIKSAPSRVVVVSSESHRYSFINADKITEEYLSPSSARNFGGMIAYNDTKLCNVLFASELNSRLSSYGVMCNSLHPGNMISSNIQRNSWFMRFAFSIVRPFTKSLEQGASTTVYCATALELNGIGGLYFNNCWNTPPSKPSQDPKLAALLWNLSEKMLEKALSRTGN